MTFKTEFPDFDETTMPAIPTGFEDTSWHNNTSPSFTSDELQLTIWIDYADISKREYQIAHPRFHVERQVAGIETGEEVITTDSWQDVLAAIKTTADRIAFEKFQATRRWSDDIGAVIDAAQREGDVPPAEGNIYMESLYIEAVQDHWPAAAKAAGEWYLLIENTEEISNDLAMLERKLFDWAVRAGYTTKEATQ